jgi:hypothetical protein
MKLLMSFLPIFTVCLFLSCNPSDKYSAEISEIDSCLHVLDEIEVDLNGIEFDSLIMMVDHVIANEDSIRKYYDPDTISMEIGKRMIESKGIRKTLTNVGDKETKFRNEIDALKTQLQSLKIDIESGVIEEEKMKEYIEKEKIDLGVLNLSFSDFYIIQEQQKRFYYSAIPIIDELIISLINDAQLEN